MMGLKIIDGTPTEMIKYLEEDEISPCPKCYCMTKSIRLGRAKYECGKCKADKSLSDYYFWEATHKEDGGRE